MNAGKLNAYVEIQKPVESTLDAHGGVARTWTRVAERWAHIRPLTAREILEAQRIVERATTMIEMEWDPDLKNVDATYRIYWRQPRDRTRTYEILAVINPDELDFDLQFLCVETGP